eukprot:jgi/Ulvmu1/5761/UM025_0015.1
MQTQGECAQGPGGVGMLAASTPAFMPCKAKQFIASELEMLEDRNAMIQRHARESMDQMLSLFDKLFVLMEKRTIAAAQCAATGSSMRSLDVDRQEAEAAFTDLWRMTVRLSHTYKTFWSQKQRDALAALAAAAAVRILTLTACANRPGEIALIEIQMAAREVGASGPAQGSIYRTVDTMMPSHGRRDESASLSFFQSAYNEAVEAVRPDEEDDSSPSFELQTAEQERQTPDANADLDEETLIRKRDENLAFVNATTPLPYRAKATPSPANNTAEDEEAVSTPAGVMGRAGAAEALPFWLNYDSDTSDHSPKLRCAMGSPSPAVTAPADDEMTPRRTSGKRGRGGDDSSDGTEGESGHTSKARRVREERLGIMDVLPHSLRLLCVPEPPTGACSVDYSVEDRSSSADRIAEIVDTLYVDSTWELDDLFEKLK